MKEQTTGKTNRTKHIQCAGTGCRARSRLVRAIRKLKYATPHSTGGLTRAIWAGVCIVQRVCHRKRERESLAGRLVFYTMYKKKGRKRGGGNNERKESPAGSHASSIVISEC